MVEQGKQTKQTICGDFIKSLGIGFYQPDGRDGYNDAIKFTKALVPKCFDKRNLGLHTIPDVDRDEIQRLAIERLEHTGRSAEYRRFFLETISFVDGNFGVVAALENTLAEMRPRGEVNIFA